MFKIMFVLAHFSVAGCGLWAVVEFFLYLAGKSISYNWDALLCMGFALILWVIFFILSIVEGSK